jgi:hypothetical protein
MTIYARRYYSVSKHRHVDLEEMADPHLLNAEKKLATHGCHHVTVEDVSSICSFCGADYLKAPDLATPCPHQVELLECLRSEILRRGLAP